MLAWSFPSKDRNTEILHIMVANIRRSHISHPQGTFCVVLGPCQIWLQGWKGPWVIPFCLFHIRCSGNCPRHRLDSCDLLQLLRYIPHPCLHVVHVRKPYVLWGQGLPSCLEMTQSLLSWSSWVSDALSPNRGRSWSIPRDLWFWLQQAGSEYPLQSIQICWAWGLC